jgi:RNA polymerase sigma-70 factor (ECF subfamily)
VIGNEVKYAARRYQTGRAYASRDADVELEFAEPAADPYAAAELRAELAGALSALSQQQRRAVLLTKEMGLTQAETARAMRAAPGTVATHVSRALVALRVTLGVLVVAGIIFATVAMWGDLLRVDVLAGGDWLPLAVTDVVAMPAAAFRSSLRWIMLRRSRRKEGPEHDGTPSTEPGKQIWD